MCVCDDSVAKESVNIQVGDISFQRDTSGPFQTPLTIKSIFAYFSYIWSLWNELEIPAMFVSLSFGEVT